MQDPNDVSPTHRQEFAAKLLLLGVFLTSFFYRDAKAVEIAGVDVEALSDSLDIHGSPLLKFRI